MSFWDNDEVKPSKMQHLKYIFAGEWSMGFESWRGKPNFDAGWIYYDGFHYYLHIWKLWVCSSTQ